MRKLFLFLLAFSVVLFGTGCDEMKGDEKGGEDLTTNVIDAVKEAPQSSEDFIQCLADAGMVVYGSRTCPACTQFAESFGGYDKIAPFYVECTVDSERCAEEMQTNYVPEIQINGVVYEGGRSHEVLAQVTGCKL